MRTLSEEGRRALNDIAARYGVSLDAVEHLLMAVIAGQTTQAQFSHPELGGMGQWSQGGMIMVGDMFNNSLKARVDGLCNELANLARHANLHLAPAAQQSQSQYQGSGSGVSLFVPGSQSAGNWWPDDLGHAASVGSQNDLRYAFFPSSRRLAINIGGRITVYDTGDHQIGGFSQQQGGDQTLSFTSQYGLIRVSDLRVVEPLPEKQVEAPMAVEPVQADTAPAVISPEKPQPAPSQPAMTAPPPTVTSEDDIFTKIERLAGLHAKGILSDQEFADKKAELLSRL